VIPFSSRIDAFDRKAVLAAPVVGFFLDRMNVENRGAAPPSAVEHARAGRFNEAVEALTASGTKNALATAFLNGLALYERGALEAAADQFRAAIKANGEFFPAVFYLGSCYAAGGKDREAAAAWQTSLVTEGDAPFIYTLLGDALLRMREADQAVDILQEAVALWPDNEQVLLRYGTALSMAGEAAEALKVLDPYLAKHPDDHERHFVAMRTIYEAHAAGKTIGTKEEDRARFDRYATAYTAAKGPQQALVDQWKRFLIRK
jgi:tetratricopeptide (TPR) repeat protein